jgi:hypothetical protein
MVETSAATVHSVAVPPKPYEDQTHHRELLQHARAKRKQHRFCCPEIVENRVRERDAIEHQSSREWHGEQRRVRVVQPAPFALRHDECRSGAHDEAGPGRAEAPKVDLPPVEGHHRGDDPDKDEDRNQDGGDLEHRPAIWAAKNIVQHYDIPQLTIEALKP